MFNSVRICAAFEVRTFSDLALAIVSALPHPCLVFTHLARLSSIRDNDDTVMSIV